MFLSYVTKSEDWASKFVWNIGTFLSNYRVWHPRIH